MKRPLLPSTRYARAAKRFLKKNPQAAEQFHRTLALLSDDAFQPRLGSHQLCGTLAGSWACSAGYDLRIIFEIVLREGREAILLHNVGTHDEVY